MTQQNYTATILVDESPKEAFDAIRNVRGWWSEEITGSTEEVGDEFKYHYQNLHKCTVRLVELVPGERVAWLVTDNFFSFTEGKIGGRTRRSSSTSRRKVARPRFTSPTKAWFPSTNATTSAPMPGATTFAAV